MLSASNGIGSCVRHGKADRIRAHRFRICERGRRDIDGVAVDNGCLSNQFVSERSTADGEQNGAKKSSHFGHHALVTPSRRARI